MRRNTAFHVRLDAEDVGGTVSRSLSLQIATGQVTVYGQGDHWLL